MLNLPVLSEVEGLKHSQLFVSNLLGVGDA
jgi:hypothetical protein